MNRFPEAWLSQQRWLSAIALGLSTLHLTLIWKLTQQPDQLLLSSLFWAVILFRLWRHRHTLDICGNRGFTSIGLILLGLLLFKSLSLFWFEASFVRLFPLLAMLGLGLLAAGRQIRQFWKDGLLILPLVFPKGLLEQAIATAFGHSIQTVTAQMAAFFLHYLGFNVMQRGAIIQLDRGAVEVMFPCTGIPILLVLVQLAILGIVIFPTSPQQRVGILLLAGAISGLVSSLRVAVLAAVVTDPVAFNYWHSTQGAQIFSTLAILAFGGGCHWASSSRVQSVQDHC